ncbi:DUF305 domain-containing protein [Nocardioides sp. ChNu-153]|uniref:DUF305 domain-containing protein n=1 Tax=unclassified Nocardioides TaxID=2615069 RepID=UPI00240516F3|nr:MULTISPECIES: DUF305 domain-containing protein [unclassified Nocardioides]MDF9717824.1 DUF305 domain-containing protein [Nocardioides sp. ChNu-99]MDN7121182.1 DUF305 domain-containing protein [Nocardioides sp. ChNu-153]
MRNRYTTRRAVTVLGLGLSLSLTAAACGTDDEGADTSSETSTTEHNDADIAFASDMLQHHSQALVMVDLTEGRNLDPAVHQLAEQIRAAQAPEIETFTDWLLNWGEEVPETMRDHVNGGHSDHDSGDATDSMEGMDHEMPGMMSAEDMSALEAAPDARFEELWLTMMIEHHTGAVEMAEAEQDNGQFQPAIDLAADITASQTAEIETMQALLNS